MTDISEQARAEAERRHQEAMRDLGRSRYASGEEYHRADGERDGFIAGVEWAASLTPEPSEDVRGYLETLAANYAKFADNAELGTTTRLTFRTLSTLLAEEAVTVTPKPAREAGSDAAVLAALNAYDPRFATDDIQDYAPEHVADMRNALNAAREAGEK